MGLSTRRKLTTAFILTMLMLGILLASVSTASAQGRGQGQDKQTFIIKIAKGISQAEGQASARRHGGTPKGSIAQLGMIVVEVPGAAAEAFTKNLQGDAAIERVEANHTRKLSATPSDSMYESQWALPKIAWDQVYGTAAPIGYADVAILDTGIDATHPDLVGAIGPGTSMIDDSQGRTDSNGHGTWVAGIVAGRTNNLDGIAGVAYSHVQVLPVKVLDADGLGQDSDIIAGILWAVEHHASVILMAFSNPGYSANLQDAIDYAWSQGVVLVAAAGNDALNTATFPAGDKSVIGVSATDQNDALATTSNFGSSIFMAAPGVDILSTYKNGAYVAWSGTSASSAMVAGAAAFMRASDPSLTNGAVVGRLARNADPAGTQDQTGNGRLQFARALADTATDEVQPLGAPPVGDGGPFVGPYKAAAGSLNLSPNSGVAGATVLVTTGGGPLDGGSAVTFTFDGSSISTTGSCTTNGGGNLNAPSACAFVVPALSAGTYSVVASTPSKTVNATFTITGNQDQTINFGPLGGKTYGDTDFTVSATASSGLAVSFSSTTLPVCTVSGSTVHIVSVGTCTVRASQGGNASFNPAPDVDHSFAVAQKLASVTPSAASKTYADADPALSGSTSGFLPADGVTAAYSRTIGEDVAGNPYTISATLSPGAVLSNYNITYNTAAFTINPASSTTAVNCPTDVTYSGSAQTPCSVSVTGAGGLSLNPTPNYANNTNAGTATASYSYAGDANHNGSSDSEDFTIGQASSTTTVTCSNVTYDGSAQTPCTVSVTGAGGLSLNPTPNYANNVNAGTATASYSFAGDANHSGSSDSKNFTIDLAGSTTTVSCSNVTYDGSAQTPCSVSVTGAGGLSLNPTPNYVNNVNAGTATASYSYAGDANHTGSSDSEDFTIGQATSTTTVSCSNVTYDGSAQTPCSVSVTGAGGLSLNPTPNYANNVNAGTATASYSYAGDANHTGSSDSEDFTIGQATSSTEVTCSNVTYDGSAQTPCTVSVTGAGGLSLTPAASYSNNVNAGTATASYNYAGDANHTGSSDSEDFTIGQATSTTEVTCSNVTYDGSAQTPCSVSVTGAGGLSLNPTPTYANNVNAGTATASYSYAGDANHTGSSDSEDFSIGQASSTTTVSCSNVTYDGSAQTPCSVSVTGAGGLSLNPTPNYANNVNAGTATASYSYAGDANHTGSNDSEDFTIGQATSTTEVTCSNVTYDGSAQTPCSVSVTGAGGLSLNPTPTYANNTNAGTATASYTYAGDANHTGSSDSEDFTIGQATSTTEVTCSNVTYDGSAQTPCSVSVTGAGGLSLNPTPNYANNVNAGTATASYAYAGDANHTGSSDSEDFTIDPASLTITANDKQKPYDGTPYSPFTVSYSGFVGGQDQSALGGSLTFSNSAVGAVNAGTYTITPGGWTSTNYQIGFVDGTLQIHKIALTVTADAKARVYGEPNPSFTATITGFVNGETDGVVSGSAAFSGTGPSSTSTTAPGSYTITPSKGTLTATNYTFDASGATYVDGTLTISKADTTTTVTSNVNPSVFGQLVTFTAQVSPVAPGSGTRTGTVQFKIDGINAGAPVALDGTGKATYSTSSLIVGHHVVDAEYSGDANFKSSANTFDGQDVNKANTTTTVTSSLNPSTYGTIVTFTVEVKAVAPGSGVPTGNVGLVIDGSPIAGVYTLDGNGKVTYQTAALTVPGSPHIVQVTYPGSDSFNLSSGSFAQGILALGTTTTVSGPANVVYSDEITLSSTVSAPMGIITGKVEFFIGTTSYGTTNLPGTGSNQTVTKTFAVLNNIGSYTVKAVYIPDAIANHGGSEGTYTPLTVKPENSFGGSLGAYTGQKSAWTPTATSNTATLTLGATIFDDPDLTAGDIRSARVGFGLRDINTGNVTPITGATNLPVGLVNPGDLKVGAAAVTLQFSLSSSEICKVLYVVVMVSGNYTMPTPPWYDTNVTICRSVPGTILTSPSAVIGNTGTGGMIGFDPAGFTNDANKTSHVEFDVKYNKSGSNPQGKVMLTVNSNRNSNGVSDGKHHVYYISTNAISTLNVPTGGTKADFSAKANIVELILDSNGAVLSTVALDGGAILQMSLDSANQTLAVQVNMSKGRGGIWYSSQWNGATTVLKAIENVIDKPIKVNGL